MKQRASFLAFLLVGTLATAGAKTRTQYMTNISTSSSATLGVTTTDGQTVVKYKGREVFSGPTQGKVSARAVTENGAEFAAVFDGDKVIWENVPGAAAHVKQNAAAPPAIVPQLPLPLPPAAPPEGAGLSVTTQNDQTIVKFKGKEVFSGRTKGNVSARSLSDNGTDYAAVFEGDKVLWENVPGAADHFKEKNP